MHAFGSMERINERKIVDTTESAAIMYLQHRKSLAPTSESLSPMTARA